MTTTINSTNTLDHEISITCWPCELRENKILQIYESKSFIKYYWWKKKYEWKISLNWTGSMCHNSFLVYSQIHFITLLKIKDETVSFLNDTVHLLSLCVQRQGKGKILKIFSCLPSPSPDTSHISYPAIINATIPSHPIMCQDMGRVATLPCAMVGVRCPSLRAPINTEGENTKNKRKDFLKETKKKKQTGWVWKESFWSEKKTKGNFKKKTGETWENQGGRLFWELKKNKWEKEEKQR